MAGQLHRDQIAGQNIERLPALQRAQTGAGNASVIQLHRFQVQHRGDATAAADAELDGFNPGQCRLRGVLPGYCPVRCAGSPLAAVRPLALAKYHAIGGEGQGLLVPALALSLGCAGAADRQGEAGGVETGLLQLIQPFCHLCRSIGPVPDKQADALQLLLIQLVSVHQPGNAASCAGAAIA